MLAVTEAAAEAITALTEQSGATQGGLRFSMRTGSDSPVALAVTVEQSPADGDQVVTADTTGANVFLEQEAADFLSDKVLDVRQDADGELNFALLERT